MLYHFFLVASILTLDLVCMRVCEYIYTHIYVYIIYTYILYIYIYNQYEVRREREVFGEDKSFHYHKHFLSIYFVLRIEREEKSVYVLKNFMVC